MRTKTLNHPAQMNLTLGSEVRFMRQLCGRESPKPNLFGLVLNGCRPPPLARGNSQQPRCVVGLSAPKILPIASPIDISEINPSVVEPTSIDVIDLADRPHVGSVEPRQSVSQVPVPINTDPSVSVARVFAASVKTCADIGASCALSSPGKNTSPSVVIKQFAQACCGKIISSHDTVPSLIGQRPARVISTGGLRYFITRACSRIAEITKCLHLVASKATGVCMPAKHCSVLNPFGALTPFNAL